MEIQERFPSIRLNQLHGLKKLIEFLEAGKTKGYFRMPTGAGKTILFGLIAQMLAEPTLILVPNTNLLHSTQEELLGLGINPNNIGIFGDGQRDEGKLFTVMTYQSFLTEGAPKGTSLFICDEVHRSLGDRTRARIDQAMEEESSDYPSEEEEQAEDEVLSRLMEDERLILGFTATPQLGRKTVEELHGELIAETSYADLVGSGILKWVEVHQVEGEVDRETEGSYMSKEKEDKLLKAAGIYEKVLSDFKAFKEMHQGYPLRTVVFCHSVKACEVFSVLAKEAGLKGLVVTGQGGDLKKAEADLLRGDCDFIITVDKLKEGWNFPPVNTILWLRGTSSPASLIQGVGRGMRAYLEEGTTYLFETDWKVSSTTESQKIGGTGTEHPRTAREGLAPSTKALTFAQALAHLGEDVSAIVRNAEDLNYLSYFEMDENGITEIPELGEAISIAAYARYRGVDFQTLTGWLSANGLSPLGAVRGRSGSNLVLLYSKSDVDFVIGNNRSEEVFDLNDNGTVEVAGFGSLCGISAYAAARQLHNGHVKRWVDEAGLVPIPGIQGRSFRRIFSLYRTEEVARAIACKRAAKTVQLGEDGTTELEGIGVVCGLPKYAEVRGLVLETLKGWVAEASTTPIAGLETLSGTHAVPIYLKKDVDAVIKSRKAGDWVTLMNGIAEVAGIGVVCGISAYSRTLLDLSLPTLVKWVAVAGLTPLKGITGKSGPQINVPLYKKSEVDAVIRRAGIGLTEEGTQFVEGIGNVCGLSRYARSKGISPQTLPEWVTAAGLEPVKDLQGRSGSQTFPLYLQTEVDRVITQRKRA
jgi:superfamily II DNA or RNA helicase